MPVLSVKSMGKESASYHLPDVDENAVYAQIANELETGSGDRGLWTRLFADSDGDEKKTKVLYIKCRAEQLRSSRVVRAHPVETAPIKAVHPRSVATKGPDTSGKPSELNDEIARLAKEAKVTSGQARDMLQFGIAKGVDFFWYESNAYEHVEDAISFAQFQEVRRPVTEDKSSQGALKKPQQQVAKHYDTKKHAQNADDRKLLWIIWGILAVGLIVIGVAIAIPQFSGSNREQSSTNLDTRKSVNSGSERQQRWTNFSTGKSVEIDSDWSVELVPDKTGAWFTGKNGKQRVFFGVTPHSGYSLEEYVADRKVALGNFYQARNFSKENYGLSEKTGRKFWTAICLCDIGAMPGSVCEVDVVMDRNTFKVMVVAFGTINSQDAEVSKAMALVQSLWDSDAVE
jgi:hypothetical protein